jgi:hypothetical protein
MQFVSVQTKGIGRVDGGGPLILFMRNLSLGGSGFEVAKGLKNKRQQSTVHETSQEGSNLQGLFVTL